MIDPNENYIPSYETYLIFKEEGNYPLYVNNKYGKIITIIFDNKINDDLKNEIILLENDYKSILNLLNKNNIKWIHYFYDFE